MRWISLIVWILICFSVAGIGGRWSATEVKGWYSTLRRPAIAPPNWVFGPVWTLLYLLMAIAAWKVWLAAPSADRTVAIALFAVQLALNLGWSWIFFHRHLIGAALAEVLILWAAIAATMAAFSVVSPAAAWLMAPYLAWVTFASALNAEFWRLNSSER
ncbi:MAG TPA: TspO/MBR family protein [Terracidiphilus sp.]|nr:TspO/MBR family protein [Terracidiphilus sp.]